MPEADVPTETEFETTPDAVAGRVLLESGLRDLAPGERDAFWEAVRRCYASAEEETPEPVAT